jgi:hypothetical protein
MRTIPDPGFPDDDGAADPDVAAALARYSSDFRPAPVLAALAGRRLLVPVLAVLGEQAVGETGHLVDKSSDMAAVLMAGRDGRKALLAFTGSGSLSAWNASARPVPVAVRLAAAAACQEGAAALLIDVAGPVRFVVEGDDLLRMAAGDVLIPVAGGHVWRPPTGEPLRTD